MGSWTAAVFATGLKQIREGNGSVKNLTGSIVRRPIKMIAAFLAAPFLVLRIAWQAKNPLRRWIAAIGLLLGILAAYLAGTFLGTLAGAALIASGIGLIFGIGFLVGTTFSIVLSLIFSMFVLQTVCFIFLQMSSEEVIAYLDSISS